MSIVLPGQLNIGSIPGYVDIPTAEIGAGSVVTDDIMVKLNQNAKMAQIRHEFIFMGYYKNGDTVPVSVSPVDGYQYGRDEVTFDFELYTTRGTTAQFTSGQAVPPDFGAQYTDLQTSGAGSLIVTTGGVFPQTLGGIPIVGQQLFIQSGTNFVAGNYTITAWNSATSLTLSVSPTPSGAGRKGLGNLYAPGGLSLTQPANLYWHAVDINDANGKVSITVSYYVPKGAETISNDGVVRVIAVCQRQSVNVAS